MSGLSEILTILVSFRSSNFTKMFMYDLHLIKLYVMQRCVNQNQGKSISFYLGSFVLFTFKCISSHEAFFAQQKQTRS